MLSDQSKNNPKSKRDHFMETARALGADEDEATFKTKLAVIARHKLKNQRAGKMNRLAALALCGLLDWPACGRAGQVWALGAGVDSCVSWTPAREAEIIGFISGFWTATNEMAKQYGFTGAIGSRTASGGIFQEVRVVCREHPTLTITEAVQRVYGRVLDQEGYKGLR